MSGVVYLVGAGPGDPRLLTIRGAQLLARADVVAYDRLVDSAVLALAPQAEHRYVGRAPGDPDGQAALNELLIEQARAGRTVVRLKGGDPFVFGRGGEECEALTAAGIAYEVVPGITSAIAAPAYAGVPVTHRNLASWVAIATGQETAGQPSSLDWDALAKAPTAVFLMGVRSLPDIARRLIEAGRDPATPAVVIASASHPTQRVVRSVLSRVDADVQEAGLRSPATLVVGATAGLSATLDWSSRLPLLGRRLLVTRPGDQLPEMLRELGGRPLLVPTITIEPPGDQAPLEAAVASLREGDYDWVVLTSQNAVDALWTALRAAGLDARAFGRARVAVVGPATAALVRRHGIEPDLVPPQASGASLAAALGPGSGSVLYPHSSVAEPGTAEALTSAGWRVQAVEAYRTVTNTGALEAGASLLEDGADAVLFTSGSTVRGFVEMFGVRPELPACCIGPQAGRVAREAGFRKVVIAADHTLAGLVGALVEAVGG